MAEHILTTPPKAVGGMGPVDWQPITCSTGCWGNCLSALAARPDSKDGHGVISRRSNHSNRP